jgi:WD40 repeat protein
LGPWRQASWSPHGEYVLLAGSDQLLAADPRGVLRWSVSRPAVRFPRWFAPNGFRVAYLSGTTLRVIAGDGTGDRQLAANVALSAPSWRPGHEYQLAYAGPRGSVIVRDADTGNVLWSRTVGARPRLLSWSADGSRLLAVSGADALVFNGSGRRIATVPTPGGARALDAALSPDGQTLALLGDGEITLVALPPRPQVTRRVFAGEGLRQLAWSPDDQWLLVTWPPADEWVFIHATGRPRIIANSRIAEQFTGTAPFFPRIDGWCCTAAGSSG